MVDGGEEARHGGMSTVINSDIGCAREDGLPSWKTLEGGDRVLNGVSGGRIHNDVFLGNKEGFCEGMDAADTIQEGIVAEVDSSDSMPDKVEILDWRRVVVGEYGKMPVGKDVLMEGNFQENERVDAAMGFGGNRDEAQEDRNNGDEQRGHVWKNKNCHEIVFD